MKEDDLPPDGHDFVALCLLSSASKLSRLKFPKSAAHVGMLMAGFAYLSTRDRKPTPEDAFKKYLLASMQSVCKVLP